MNYQDLTDDFRAFLQLEYSRRCQQNLRYSLRAFALSLDIDASSLSQFLRKKRNISEKKMKSIALKIGLTEDDFTKFVSASQSEKYQTIAADHFMILSEWYHIAICELCNLNDFRNNTKWIAQRLGVQELHVVAAIERLVRVGWVKKEHNTLIYVGGDLTTVNSDIALSARSQLQKQILTKASEAMDLCPSEHRSQTGMTMAISRDKVSQANEMITKFRRKLCKFLEDTDHKSDVYHLSISLFPLTKN